MWHEVLVDPAFPSDILIFFSLPFASIRIEGRHLGILPPALNIVVSLGCELAGTMKGPARYGLARCYT